MVFGKVILYPPSFFLLAWNISPECFIWLLCLLVSVSTQSVILLAFVI